MWAYHSSLRTISQGWGIQDRSRYLHQLSAWFGSPERCRKVQLHVSLGQEHLQWARRHNWSILLPNCFQHHPMLPHSDQDWTSFPSSCTIWHYSKLQAPNRSRQILARTSRLKLPRNKHYISRVLHHHDLPTDPLKCWFRVRQLCSPKTYMKFDFLLGQLLKWWFLSFLFAFDFM